MKFNRLSIGVQDFNDDTLAYIGRRHTGKQATEALEKARKRGFKRINIDLIYGLPTQTIESWRINLAIVKDLMPEYVTTYHLRREKGTPIGRLDPSDFPSKEESMYLESLERLVMLGYIQIAPNQFALPTHTFVQQENKWKRGDELVGLGASAYSFFEGFVYYNVRSIERYAELVEEGKLPIWIGEKVPIRDLMRRNLIFGLKTSGINRDDGGLNKRIFKNGFGISPNLVFNDELERLKELELIEEKGDFIRLTLKGLVLSEEVCRELYSQEIKTQLDKIEDKFGRGGL